jgi:hypothetical protein
VPPVSWTVGSFDPPLRTTFFGGGQGFKAAESAFFDVASVVSAWVDPAWVEPALVGSASVDPAAVDPASIGLAGLAGWPTAAFSAVGEFEHLEGIAFRRCRAGDGLAGAGELGVVPVGEDEGFAGSGLWAGVACDCGAVALPWLCGVARLAPVTARAGNHPELRDPKLNKQNTTIAARFIFSPKRAMNS